MPRRFLRNSVAVWLALFSIAILFVAPVISKTISHQTACEHDVTAMKMPDGRMLTEPDQMISGRDHLEMSRQIMSPVEDMACGYCQLLIHLPFVLLILTHLLWQVLLLFLRLYARHIVSRPVNRIWTSQCARAPPATFLDVYRKFVYKDLSTGKLR